MLAFTLIHPRMTVAHLGLLPGMCSAHDPRPAREQLHDNYAHGGGWRPFTGFTLTKAGLEFPGDRTLQLLAEAKLRDEVIRLYECDWVAIIQPDGSYEIARMD